MKNINTQAENLAVLGNVAEVIVRALKKSGDRSIITSESGVPHTEESLTKLVLDQLTFRLKSKGDK